MKNLYIVDGSSYFYRAFYGNKSGLRTSKGVPTNAVYTFASMLGKLVDNEQIDYLVVVFDKGKPAARLELYPEYKANRQKMPDDLRVQIPYIEKLVDSLNIANIGIEGAEADDIVGTITSKLSKEGVKCTIVSGDKDFMQLLDENTVLLDTMKDRLTTVNDVPERIGLKAEQVIDYLAIMGDSSDNIPGAAGIGPKGAAKLLAEYGNIEGIYENIDKISGKKLVENLNTSKENVYLSRKLATIETKLDYEFNIEDFKRKKPDPEKQKELYTELEFTSLLEGAIKDEAQELKNTLVNTDEGLKALVETLSKVDLFAFDTETTSLSTIDADLVGISLSCQKGEGYYIPVGHIKRKEGENSLLPSFEDEDNSPEIPQLSIETVKEALNPFFTNKNIKKVAHNIKYDLAILEKYGFEFKGELFDTMIASYLLDPDRNQNGLDALAHAVLNRKMISYKDVCGAGQKEISFAEVEIPIAAEYSVEDSEVTLCLYEKLFPLLEKEEGSYKIFREMEIPLMLVIKEMEKKGVKIDKELFSGLSKQLDEKSKTCVNEISEMIGGEEVNLNSTKQLSEILFERIGLKPIKKTKTGYSTDISVLEKLAEIHPLPAKILDYRQYEKLKNTYVDKLPKLISKKTGRIHTSFNQTIAATGRLSSNNPNLQNIPARTDAGKEIRKGFVPEEGFTMIAADYSQIELRLLAHFSQDKSLIEAFCDGRDIHKETAARLNNVMLEMVTEEMRYMAKAVNFGIIYGQTPFGLSKQLKISMKEAKSFIDNYFMLFPGISTFMKESIEKARDLGHSETLYGRKRYIHDINSANKNLREYAERTAVNSTIQGAAADIIKMAMINIQKKIAKEKLKGSMILQVHDELVFEVANDSVDAFLPLIKKEMEHVLELSVPLTVDINIGPNWQAAKG